MSTTFKSTRDVIVRTRRFAAAKEFYQSVLGFAVAFEGEALMGYESGSFRLYVEEGADHGAVFEFKVADLAAARSALLAAGCELIEEDPNVPRCYFRDPFGLVFNIEAGKP